MERRPSSPGADLPLPLCARSDTVGVWCAAVPGRTRYRKRASHARLVWKAGRPVRRVSCAACPPPSSTCRCRRVHRRSGGRRQQRARERRAAPARVAVRRPRRDRAVGRQRRGLRPADVDRRGRRRRCGGCDGTRQGVRGRPGTCWSMAPGRRSSRSGRACSTSWRSTRSRCCWATAACCSTGSAPSTLSWSSRA
jgi:hypothetical protein